MKKQFDVLLSIEAKSFVKSLDVKLQRKVIYNIQKARQINDPRILKKLTDVIWEFRTRFGNQQIRLLAFGDPNNDALIICSHGFVKKTKKIPKAEIDKALAFRRRYQEL